MNRATMIPVYLIGTANWPSLSLGLLQAYAESKNSGLKGYYQFEYISPKFISFCETLAQRSPAIWLFSDYIWNVDLNLSVSKLVKSISSKHITIHGGPSAPKYEVAARSFLKKNPHIDIMVRGEGELSLTELLEHIEPKLGKDPEIWLSSFADISGITIAADKPSENVIRTVERKRINDLDIIPSPYLTGIFDKVIATKSSATLESNRGCPYGCTFCDWGSLTQQKIRKFDLQRVKDEISYLASKQVEMFFLADANFGIFERDLEIAEHLARTKHQTGYPAEIITNYAKNSKHRLSEIIKIWTKAGLTNQGVISIQTTDQKTLEAVERSNIKIENYHELTASFKKEGLPLSIDLMIGLPGSTIDSLKQDLQTYFDQDIFVQTYKTSLLPNSPMADPDYIKKFNILVDDNDKLISTYSYSVDDHQTMVAMARYYQLFEKYSFLRYVLRFVQWEYSIQAVDFVLQFSKSSHRYPTANIFLQNIPDRVKLLELSSCVDDFYIEVENFILSEYGFKIDSAFSAVMKFNKAVMPVLGRTYPLELELEHDVIQYFADYLDRDKSVNIRALKTYKPGKSLIDDPERLSVATGKQDHTRQVFWELNSPLRAVKSHPNFKVTP